MKILNFILKYFGIKLVAVPYVSDDLLDSAKELIEQANNMAGSGEYKRAQVLRAMLNRHPEVRERDVALAIELALR